MNPTKASNVFQLSSISFFLLVAIFLAKPFKCRQFPLKPFCSITRQNIFVMRASTRPRDLQYPTFGIKIDAKSLIPQYFRDKYDGKLPVVLRNVFDFDNENMTSDFFQLYQDKRVEFDIRDSKSGNVETYESTLSDFIEACGSSTHNESFYLMHESLLEDTPHLLESFQLPRNLFGENYFEHFPNGIRPKAAIIIGGAGARSFLHADPYEWTGWNYLLEVIMGGSLCMCVS